MIAIDWSHTKDLTTFDGKKVRMETQKTLLSRMARESIQSVKSIPPLPSPSVVLEQGCPMNLIYTLVSHRVEVRLIDNKATEHYRKEYNIEKTDENDAKIIYELATNGLKTTLATPDTKMLQLTDLYHQYCRYQKARVAMENMRKAHKRQYGLVGGNLGGESKSIDSLHLQPDFLAYDTAIDTLKGKEKGLLKQLNETMKRLPLTEMVGGKSIPREKSTSSVQPPTIKGLGQRIWIGLIVTTNPANFKCLSAYLRYCGLTNDAIVSHKYNRHARMLYHMLAEEVMKQRDPVYRPIYDKCKVDIATKHSDYTKGHIHNAALNRTATFLAKEIFANCEAKPC